MFCTVLPSVQTRYRIIEEYRERLDCRRAVYSSMHGDFEVVMRELPNPFSDPVPDIEELDSRSVEVQPGSSLMSWPGPSVALGRVHDSMGLISG